MLRKVGVGERFRWLKRPRKYITQDIQLRITLPPNQTMLSETGNSGVAKCPLYNVLVVHKDALLQRSTDYTGLLVAYLVIKCREISLSKKE